MTAAFALTAQTERPTARVTFPKAPAVETAPARVTLSFAAADTAPYRVAPAAYRVDGDTLTAECDRCADGLRPEHMDVAEGVCFACNGTALRPDRFTGTLDQAKAHYRTRSMAAVNRTRAKNRRLNAAHADRRAWIAAHPHLVTTLARYSDDIATLAARADQTGADPRGVARRAGSSVPDLVEEFAARGHLTAAQVTALTADADRIHALATGAPTAAEFAEGDRVEFTGTVVDTDVSKGNYGWRTLFVLARPDGTRARLWTSSATFDGLMRGEEATVTGTVGGFGLDLYTGTPTVTLHRAKRV